MVCNRELFKYLPDDPGMMLEQSPMKDMTAAGALGAFKHDRLLAADGYVPGIHAPQQDVGVEHRALEGVVTRACARVPGSLFVVSGFCFSGKGERL